MKQRHAIPSLAIASACATALSCSALVTFDGLEGDVNVDAGDARAVDSAPRADGAFPSDTGVDDATMVVDAGDEDSAPEGTVLYTEGFESGCDNSYGAFQASLASSSVAHTGSGSCEVCFAGGTLFYTIDHQLLTAAPAAGSVIYAQAWVRAISSASAPQSSQFSLRTFADSNFDALEDTTGGSVMLSTAWQLVTTTFSPTMSGNFGWDYYVGTNEPNDKVTSGDCFLIDDVVITQIH